MSGIVKSGAHERGIRVRGMSENSENMKEVIDPIHNGTLRNSSVPVCPGGPLAVWAEYHALCCPTGTFGQADICLIINQCGQAEG